MPLKFMEEQMIHYLTAKVSPLGKLYDFGLPYIHWFIADNKFSDYNANC